LYIVIDTWVWQRAQEFDSTCLHFLTTLYHECKHTVLCDSDGEIEKEYYRYMDLNLVKKIFTELIRKGKVEKKYRCKIENDFGFDPNDMKFLEVAVLVNAKIVSDERDFSLLKQKLQTDEKLSLRLNKVQILTPAEAMDLFSR
jgi:predicted nucleic acid-binding protein